MTLFTTFLTADESVHSTLEETTTITQYSLQVTAN